MEDCYLVISGGIVLECNEKRGGPVLNFINILRTAFMLVDPKSVKNTVVISIFLHFWDLRG